MLRCFGRQSVMWSIDVKTGVMLHNTERRARSRAFILNVKEFLKKVSDTLRSVSDTLGHCEDVLNAYGETIKYYPRILFRR